jgi:ketosteroid isomerase-like protein
MASETENLVRRAFEAFVRGDVDAVLELIDAELEWTFLDPSLEDPQPQVCHGRGQLAYWIGRQPRRGPRLELEEIVGYDDRVLVVTHAPGLDDRRARKSGDRNFNVVTVREGRIVAMRACRSRQEAIALAEVA